MYKDDSKPDEFVIVSTFKESWNDAKSALQKHKNSLTALGFLMTITALFLGIDSTNHFLNRIQALLLLALTITISYIIISSLLTFFHGKHSELYYGIAITIQALGLLFVYNLFGYLFSNFNQELTFYLKWTGIPIIGLLTNIFSIYFFRLIKKYKKVQGSQLENFFLIILNYNIVAAYVLSNFDFVITVKRLTALQFNNLYLLLIFFVTLFMEVRSFDNKTKKAVLIESIILLVIIVAPLIIKYVL